MGKALVNRPDCRREFAALLLGGVKRCLSMIFDAVFHIGGINISKVIAEMVGDEKAGSKMMIYPGPGSSGNFAKAFFFPRNPCTSRTAATEVKNQAAVAIIRDRAH